MTRQFRLLSAAALGAALLAPPAMAQTRDELVVAGMRTGWRIAPGAHMAALDLTLRPGWKTYWRSPGAAGIPPSFDWSGSENLAGVELHWPRPRAFDQNGMRSIGYHDRLVLPMEFIAKDATQPISLRGSVDIGVCNDICVPVSLTLQAELVPAGGVDPVIADALAEQPHEGSETLRQSLHCEVEPIADGVQLTAHLQMPDLGPDEAAVIELSQGDAWVSETMLRRDGDNLTASADIVPPIGAPFAVDRSSIRITLIGQDRAIDLRGCPSG